MSAWIGVDAGTTNTKVVLVDADSATSSGSGRGVTVASAQRSVPITTDGDAVTQDVDALFAAVAAAVAEVACAAPEVAARISVIGICSQFSSLVPLGADTRPTGPMSMWLDHRGTDASWAIIAEHPQAFETWIERHGIPPVGGGLSLGHLLRFEADPPPGTVAYCEAMDALTARMTGRITATQHTMFTGQVCDNRTLGAVAYDNDLLDMAGLTGDRLPELVPVGSRIGGLTAEAADSMGLAAGIPVFTGSNDTGTVLVASGALRPNAGGLSIGTTAVLVDTVDRMDTDLDHEVLSMPSALPDEYIVCAENGLGGKAVEQTLTSLVTHDDVFGPPASDPFGHLDAALSASVPGAGGAMCLPWFNGTLAPNSDTAQRGAMLNLSLTTQRVDVVRATAEGVAHNLAWLLPHVEAFTGVVMGSIGAVGGGVRSDQWCQIMADILGRPIERRSNPQLAVAVGAAALAAHHAGELERGDLIDAMATDRSFEPAAQLAGFYTERQGVFEQAFETLAPLHHALQGLEGVEQ